MATHRVNTSYGLPSQSVTFGKKQSTEKASPFASLLAQKSGVSILSSQSPVEKVQAANAGGVPAGFEQMAATVEQLKQQIEELMVQAREATGFTGKVCQGAAGSLYGIGAYSIYDPETEAWQWYNEDGSRRDGPPSEEEFIEQARIAAPKAQAYKQYLIDKGVYEIMDQLSREETILDCAKQSERFRSDYLADPEAALGRNSGMLASRRSHFGYRAEGAGGAGVWYGAQPLPQLYSTPGEIKRIDIADVLRSAGQSVERWPFASMNYSTQSSDDAAQWWRK